VLFLVAQEKHSKGTSESEELIVAVRIEDDQVRAHKRRIDIGVLERHVLRHQQRRLQPPPRSPSMHINSST
jgi:hypothetical protein